MCKPYSEITVESGTQQKLYIFALYFRYVLDGALKVIFFAKLGPRRGAVNGWIMISFCQEMACLAVYSGF